LKKQPAIEIWALYSYNLHKATFQGLNNLPSRRNKRNFIIGRGSFAGMHRYSGLWTGDNGSTWDFWKISISQVLSLGLSGVSIVGSDIGGFMPNGNEKFCDPDLLIRWYSGAFLLPWFRNHYVKKNGGKLFQACLSLAFRLS
jgi:alpha-glucosidase (family GH31 glycosyl hydrolase)